MNTLNAIYTWIVTSSADPEKLSLTVKSFVAVAITISVFFGYDFGNQDDIVQALVHLVSGVGLILSSISFIFGLSRKVYITASRR